MAELARVTVGDQGGVMVASIAGEIDISNVVQVKTTLMQAVRNQSAGIVLDLTRTTYLDSAAVSLVFELADRARERGHEARVVIAEPSPVRRVLEITGVDQVASFAADLEAAVAEVRSVP